VSTEETASRAPRDDRAGWVRPIVLAASCLVLGFVAGWSLRGGEDNPIVIPEARVGTTTAPETPTTSTTPAASTTTGPSTVTEVEPPPPPPPALPEPAQIRLAVLNGSGVTGLAGQTATRAEGLGYTGVTAGNAAPQSGPSVVYYRSGAQLAARRVAQDLGYAATQARPLADEALVAEAPADAQVIVVLGPG